jgi:hypothetical protein
MAGRNPEDIRANADVLQQLREMCRYLPVLEDPDFVPGELSPIQRTESGSIVMPYFIFGDIVEDFITAAYEHRWVLRGFDWVSWTRTEEAKAMCSDPSALAQATAEQLFHLITALMRQDRFSEGTLLGSFESGLILGIVRRAAVILKDEQRRHC